MQASSVRLAVCICVVLNAAWSPQCTTLTAIPMPYTVLYSTLTVYRLQYCNAGVANVQNRDLHITDKVQYSTVIQGVLMVLYLYSYLLSFRARRFSEIHV